MPGFCISNLGQNIQLNNFYEAESVKEAFSYEDFFCGRNTLNRFMDDKAFVETSDYIVIAEGVILNKRELFETHNCNDILSLIITLYHDVGECFFDVFRGSFSGAIFDKSLEKWVIYTNHYGDNPVFYFFDENGNFIFGSQVNYILNALYDAGRNVTLCKPAVYYMLTYGFMIDDSTYANEIKRLEPGRYALIFDNQLDIVEYYRPKQNAIDLSGWTDENILKELDNRFKKAIEREYSKDIEYGFSHLADLSGGLDSRMVNWVASENGFRHALNISYSQSGYPDETIASDLASYLGNELIFKPLDDANFVLEASRIISMNYGLSLYSGITGGESLLRNLNMSLYGLEHTGQIGDVAFGSFLKSEKALTDISHSGMYSTFLEDKLPSLNAKKYQDREQYLYDVRAFLGALSSHFIRRNYTEVASPFLDVDVLDFCLSIPISKRANHQLYRKWIRDFHHQAGEFAWEKEGVKPNVSKPIAKLFKLKYYARTAYYLFLNPNSKHRNMNPFDYWFKVNPQIKEYFESIMNSFESDASVDDDIKEDVSSFYRNSTALEKVQIVTAILSIYYYFPNEHQKSYNEFF